MRIFNFIFVFKNTISEFNILKHLCITRLHREALKQSAIDPLSGKIDISILTTGMSLAARKRKQELVEALKKLIKEKGKAPTLNYQKIFTELKESSSMVSFSHYCLSYTPILITLRDTFALIFRSIFSW